MATKHDTNPTANIFSLLEELETSAPRTPQPKNKGQKAGDAPKPQMTPKERMEANEKQRKEREAKQKAEAERKKEEAARKQEFERAGGNDLGDFVQQRTQRVKEQKQKQLQKNAQPEPKSQNQKEGGQKFRQNRPNNQNNQNNQNQNNQNKGADNQGQQVQRRDNADKFQEQRQFQTRERGRQHDKEKYDDRHLNNADVPHRGRQFDKHSAGKTSRQQPPKKQGAGKANWGPTVDEVAATATTGSDVAAAVEGWGDETATDVDTKTEATDASATVTDEKASEDAAVDANKEKKDDKEKDDHKGWEHLAEIREAQRKELEAKLAGVVGNKATRELTPEEKAAHAQYAALQKTKGSPLEKTSFGKPKQTTEQKAPETDSATNKKEKKQKTVVETDFRIQRPRDDERPRGKNNNNNNNKNAGRGGQQNAGNRGNNPNPGNRGPRAAGRGGNKIDNREQQFPELQ